MVFTHVHVLRVPNVRLKRKLTIRRPKSSCQIFGTSGQVRSDGALSHAPYWVIVAPK